MSRITFLLTAAIGLVWCLPQQVAGVGPVMRGLEAYAELAALTPAREGADAPAGLNPATPAENDFLPSGPMSGAVSATSASSGASRSALAAPTACRPIHCVEGGYIFVPPRSLDGIFRPPRSFVSP